MLLPQARRGPENVSFCGVWAISIFLLRSASTIAIEPHPDGRPSGCTAAEWRAGVAELVDAPDLGSGGENRGGSSPSARTIVRAYPKIAEFSVRICGRAGDTRDSLSPRRQV